MSFCLKIKFIVKERIMELYKRRSISECLSEGWTLMSTNIKRIAKAMWLPTLLIVVFAAFVAPTIFILEKHNIENSVTTTDGLLAGAIFLAMIAILIYFSAKLFKLLNEQTIRFCVTRMTKITGVVLGFAVLLSLALVGIATLAIAVIAKGIVAPAIGVGLFAIIYLLAIIAVIVVFAPMNYVGVKYMIEPEMNLKGIFKAYKRGWKNLGKIVGFTLLSSLVIYIAQCIISLPGVIAMLAASLSLQGIAYGDPSGLPSAFMVILGITMGISSIITSILMIWFTLSEYYLYASIESKYRQ